MNSSLLIRKLKLLLAAAATIFSLFNSVVLGGPVVLDTAINPANGHTYYLLDSSDWTNAENAAVGLGGHLATINDLAENNWIWDRWGTNRNLWIGLYDPIIGDGGGTQHAADFVWTSGDSSNYRNWRPGEPNGDDYTYVLAKGLGGGGQWNDIGNVTSIAGQPPLYGVVEVGFCSPHQATATAILDNGFVVGANIVDSGCGYTNPPQVLIQGGGGSGATATATISNGVVTAINITSAGSGYTDVPDILIGSPPFAPMLGIRFSAVKVTQHVVLGFNYILESSTNLLNWTATGPAFTATNETMVSEFEIDFTGQYFRIKQVP
jgi:hypothetical protein